MEFLRKLNEEGVTVVMITHDMHLMLEYTPRALVFADGRLIADDSAAAVLCNRELVERAASEGNQFIHSGKPCRYHAAGSLCGMFYRRRSGGAQSWPLIRY